MDIYTNVYNRSTGRISSLPYSPMDMSLPDMPRGNIIYVTKDGSDDGTGSMESPFRTVIAAMNSITNASPDNRYEVRVGPGRYVEVVSIKANVFIVGASIIATIIDFIDTYDSTWTVDEDNRSGISAIEVYSTVSLDFATTRSTQAKFYISQCRIAEPLVYEASSSINQIFLYNCELLGDIVQVGGVMALYSCTVDGGLYLYSQSSARSPTLSQVDTKVFLSGGGQDLPLDTSGYIPPLMVVNQSTPTDIQNIYVDNEGFSVPGTLSINGSTSGITIVYSQCTGIPRPDRLSITGNGQLVLQTYSNSIGYIPADPSVWSGSPPSTVSEAIDRMANTVAVLNGGPIP